MPWRDDGEGLIDDEAVGPQNLASGDGALSEAYLLEVDGGAAFLLLWLNV